MQENQDSGARVWWYANGTQQHGPISAHELKRIAAEGGLQPDALVWREGMAEWIAASSVRGLMPETPPPAPAPDFTEVSPAPAPGAPPAWAAASAHPVDNEAPWFAVSTRKLLVMSIFTLSFYSLYWFYKQWWRVKQREGSDILPFWRAVFAIFFAHSLFKRIRAEADAARLPHSFEAGTMAVAFIVLSLVGNFLPGPLTLVAMLSVLTLTPAQELANRINAQVAPDHPRNDRYSSLNITGMVLGGLMLVMAFLGSMLPEEAAEEAPRRKPGSSAPVALSAPDSLQA